MQYTSLKYEYWELPCVFIFFIFVSRTILGNALLSVQKEKWQKGKIEGLSCARTAFIHRNANVHNNLCGALHQCDQKERWNKSDDTKVSLRLKHSGEVELSQGRIKVSCFREISTLFHCRPLDNQIHATQGWATPPFHYSPLILVDKTTRIPVSLYCHFRTGMESPSG